MPINLFSVDPSHCVGCMWETPSQLKSTPYYYVTKYFTEEELEKSEELTRDWVRFQQVYSGIKVILPALLALKAGYQEGRTFGTYQEFVAGASLRAILRTLEDNFIIVCNATQRGVWHKECIHRYINEQLALLPTLALETDTLFFGVTIPAAAADISARSSKVENHCAFPLCGKFVRTQFTAQAYDGIAINKEATFLTAMLIPFKLHELISILSPTTVIPGQSPSRVRHRKPGFSVSDLVLPRAAMAPNILGIFHYEGAHFSLEILRHNLERQFLPLHTNDIILAKKNDGKPVCFHTEHFFTLEGKVIARSFSGGQFLETEYNEVIRIMAN